MVRNLFRSSQKLLERQQTSILSAATVITLAVFLSSLLGFLRTRLLVAYFYSQYTNLIEGAALDAYMVSFQIPEFVFQLLVIGALSAAFIPVYSKYQNRDKESALRLVNSMVNLILLIFLLISMVIFIWAAPLTRLLTGAEFSQAQLELATRFTRVMLVAQFFFAASSFITGIIQANQRFLIPALSPIAYNIGIIFGIIVLGPHMGLYGAAIGVIIGAFFHLILQLPLALRLGYRYQPLIDLSHPGVKEMSRLMAPRVLALSVDRVELLFVTFLATTIPYKGSYVIVTLAQQLMKTPVRIFGVPIGQASLPFLSQESAKNNLSQFKATFLNSLHQILYLALPAAVLLLVLRIPLVRILYGAKGFPWQSTLLTGRMIAIMALAVVAHAAIQLVSRAYYALHNTRVPFISALLSLIASSGSSWYLVVLRGWDVTGIAVGLTLGPIAQLAYLMVILLRKLDGFELEELIIPFIKMVFAASLMGVFLWIPMRLFDEILDTTRTINLIMLTLAASSTGGMVYLWLSQLLEIKQQQAVIKILNKLGNWHKTLSSSEEALENPTEQN